MKPNSLNCVLGVFLCALLPLTASAAGSYVEVGDFLTANYYGNKVYKVDPQTGVKESLGSFIAPMDLALTAAGDLYVGELGGVIKRLTITNAQIAVINPGSALTAVRGLTLAADGYLYVTGTTNDVDVVMRLNPVTGAEQVISHGGNLSLPVGIEMLNPDYLVVACFLNSSIVRVRISDGAQNVIASGGVWIDRPWGIAVSGDIIYASHYDSKHINRVSASLGTSSLLGTAPGTPYGIGLDAQGNILVGAAGNVGQQDMLAKFSPAGVLLENFNIGLRQQISGIEVSRYQIGTPRPNQPPVISPVEDKTVDEGVTLAFPVIAADPEAPPQTLAFRLGGGAPHGAVISPDGSFSWTPGPTYGPGTYPVAIIVSDDGIPSFSDTNVFLITVNDMTSQPGFVIKVGDIVAADFDGNAVIKVDPFTGAAGILGALVSPTDVAVSSNGYIYASEYGGTVKRLDPADGAITVVNSNSTLSGVWGLALGPAGEIYATSDAANSVVQIDPVSGAETPLSQGNLLAGPCGIALLDPEHLVVASMYNNSVVAIALSDGTQSLLVSDPTLDVPWDVAVQGTNIFVTCYGGQTIQKVWQGGVEPACILTNGFPLGLAVEAEGSLLAGISEPSSNLLSRWSEQGAMMNSWSGSLIGQLTGMEVSLFHIEITNRPPAPLADSIQRYLLDGTKVLISTLLTNDFDPDGDLIQFVSAASTSANGGTVTRSGDCICYAPAPGFTNVDSFTYTIADAYGLQAWATVNVAVTSNFGPSLPLAIAAVGNGSYQLRFDGVPGRTYRIEFTEQIAPPNWQLLGTGTADAVGMFEFVDTPPVNAPMRWYRSSFP